MTSYGYDTARRLQTITDPTGAVQTFAYDDAGNVNAVTDRPVQLLGQPQAQAITGLAPRGVEGGWQARFGLFLVEVEALGGSRTLEVRCAVQIAESAQQRTLR